LNKGFKISKSAEQTKKIARNFAKKHIKGNDIIALYGELGAGKSVFVKGLASYYNINERKVKSPTYTILNIYDGNLKVYHLDLYRIGDIEEIYYLGYEDFSNSGGITIIEWAEKIEDILPADIYKVKILIEGKNKRKIIGV